MISRTEWDFEVIGGKFSLHITQFECVKKTNLSSVDFEDQDLLLHNTNTKIK